MQYNYPMYQRQYDATHRYPEGEARVYDLKDGWHLNAFLSQAYSDTLAKIRIKALATISFAAAATVWA